MATPRPLSALLMITLALALAACNLPAQAGQPAQVSLPTATQPAPQVLGPCKNPLLPVIKGATWTYTMSGITTGTFTRTITDVRADGFTEQDIFDTGVMRIGEWKCENGTLISLSPAEGISGIVSSGGMTTQFTTTSSSGVTLPAIVSPGDSWSQTFAIEGSQTVGVEQVQGTGHMEYTCKASETETVVTATGGFDAVRVGCQINGTITSTVAGVEVPTTLTSATTIWYSRDIGMVKTENEVSGIGHSSIELTSFTIP